MKDGSVQTNDSWSRVTPVALLLSIQNIEQLPIMADFVELCRSGKLSKVIAAVGRGVDVNSVDTGGDSGLMEAVKNSHNQVIEWLLQQPAIDVSRRGWGGYTALHQAVWGKNPVGLSLLLATADTTVRNNYGNTPLELCRWGTDGPGEA